MIVINDNTHGEGTEGANNPYALMVVGGTWNTTPIPSRPKIAIYGDSHFLAWRTSASDAPAWLIQYDKNVSVAVRGIGGSTVVGAGQYDMANVTNMSPAPNYVVVEYGGNDDVSDASLQQAFQSAYQAMLTAIASAMPSVPIRCLGIIPSHSQTLDIRTAKNGLIQAAINAVGLPNATFGEVESFNIDPDADTVDFTHWNRSGGLKVAAGIEAMLGL